MRSVTGAVVGLVVLGHREPVPPIVVVAVAVLLGCGGAKERPPSEVHSPPSSAAASAAPTTTAKPDEGEAAAPTGSLLARLGGRAKLVVIVDALVKEIEADPKLHLRFSSVLTTGRVDAFKKNLVDELCVLAGGACAYRGRSLGDAHRALHVTEAEWNAFMIDLNGALRDNGVGETEQLDLLSVLAPLRTIILKGPGSGRR